MNNIIQTIAVLAFTQTFLFSQNLVENGSFENFVNCPPANWTNGVWVPGWNKPTNHEGSPDSFHPCDASMPSNGFGTQNPYDGDSYAGMYVSYVDFTAGRREYIQGSLTSSLTAGTTYEISFYVSLADGSEYACNNFEWYFSNSELVLSTVGMTNGEMYKYLEFHGVFADGGYYGSPITDKNGWTLVSGLYTASGGETNFVIGNFHKKNETSFTTMPSGSYGLAYYYIDDVSVTPVVSLGVELLSMKVDCSGDDKSLGWKVASETNNDFYTVDFSNDGVNWDSAINVDGVGNSQDTIEYSYKLTDEVVRNYQYLRLSQTDVDGTVSVLRYEKLDCKKDDVLIYPNPFEDVLYVKAEMNAKIEIFNVTGKLVFSTLLENGQDRVSTTLMSKGVYVAKISQMNGTSKTFKLLKQ